MMHTTASEAYSLILAGTAPAGLTVGGSLYLSDTQIAALPEGLTVGGELRVDDCDITSWSNLTVRGHKVADPETARLRLVEIARHVLATPDALDMETWHDCDTVHCVSGWSIHNAGSEGYALESATSAHDAGTILLGPLGASMFYNTKAAATEKLRQILEAA